MKTYSYLQKVIKKKGAAYLVLIDPDNVVENNLVEFIVKCEKFGVDGFLVGGSLLINGNIEKTINIIKSNSKLPVIIFPGAINQITPDADAILYLSLVSGRNAEHLIGKHVLAAPIIKKYAIEPISTGYILIESGSSSTAEYISASIPIPRNKPNIAAATALAAQYLGMKLIYLEAGSGAKYPVPNKMVQYVSSACDIPVVVGGGLRSPITIREKVEAGAKIIVTGNYFENKGNWDLIKEFADAVHINLPIEI